MVVRSAGALAFALIFVCIFTRVWCRGVLFTSQMPLSVTPTPEFYSNTIGRPLVVLAAPSLWDDFYQEKFADLIRFDVQVAQSIMRKDNVLVLADRHTIPFLTGEKGKVTKGLPDDVILEADLYDIFLRDFAPLGRREVKFKYSPVGANEIFTQQVDESFMRLMKESYVELKEKSPISLQGTQVVDNGRDRAIVSSDVMKENAENYQDWAVMIQLFNFLGRTAFVRPPLNSTLFNRYSTLRFADLMAFVDDNILALSELEEPDRTHLIKEVKLAFRDLQILEVPSHPVNEDPWRNRTSACGVYTNLIVTDKFVYQPVFGNDMANWQLGLSTVMDRLVTEMLQVNTRKTVVPINVPHTICQMGAGLRGLSWTVRGSMADQLIDLARRRSITRAKKLKSRKGNAG